MICLIHLEGEQPQLGDLLIIVTDHLLTGMILQVGPPPKSNRSNSYKLINNTPMEKVT